MELKKVVEKEMAATQLAMSELNWTQPKVYADWLSQTYYFVAHTTRLLGLAAGVARLDQQDYHEQFVYHLKEEHGHEKLAESDLKALGESKAPERAETRYFYETEFAVIQKAGAVGLFGYMLFLEATAITVGPKIYESISAKYGKKAGRFLAVHAHEDIEHVEVTLKTLSKASVADQSLICEHLKLSGQNYRALLKAIGLQHGHQAA